jgi:hypothetical protein
VGFLGSKFVLAIDYAMDHAKSKPDYADLILKPDYSEMTCPNPDNSDHC